MKRLICLIGILALSGCASNIVFDRAAGTVTANDYVIRETIACPKNYTKPEDCRVTKRVYTPASIFRASDVSDFLGDIIPLVGKTVGE